MKFTIKEERPITSIEDLQMLKNHLVRKSDKQSEKIKHKFDNILNNTNVQDVYDEILDKFDLQHGLMNMLPLVLKYKDYILNSKIVSNAKETVQKPKFVFWSTFIGVFSSIAYFQVRKRYKLEEENYDE